MEEPAVELPLPDGPANKSFKLQAASNA